MIPDEKGKNKIQWGFLDIRNAKSPQHARIMRKFRFFGAIAAALLFIMSAAYAQSTGCNEGDSIKKRNQVELVRKRKIYSAEDPKPIDSSWLSEI